MTEASTPPAAEAPTAQEQTTAPRVKVILTPVEGADLKAALAMVGRQVYVPQPEVVVVHPDPGELPVGVTRVGSLEEAIAATDQDISYLWILHSDARPRPDALSALVTEVERNEAALGGSKLLRAGTPDVLESVGSATDVFGEPYSGLDEGEIDLQQYDVVREVAFVGSASMLVRRDLAQGLKGLDPRMPPVAAGLDFSQKTRLAGGRVISVPSSEVYHQDRCQENMGGWREQAGRLRAMVVGYSPLTLAWVLPYDFAVSLLDAIANLFLLRVKPALDYLRSWLWNLVFLPSTIGQRRRFRPVRGMGDEELFRFQARGSVRLRETFSELSSRFISVFDEDQALVRGARRIWTAPGLWGAGLAVAVILIGARSIILGGMSNIGSSFPFEPGREAFRLWFDGWSDSSSPVHPSVGVNGVLAWLPLGSLETTRTLATIGFGLLAVLGMGRLAGRIGLRGPGRYLSGLVLLGGPGIMLITGAGSWTALAAASLLPWAVRTGFIHPSDTRPRLAHVGWALVIGVLLAAFSPALIVVPLVSAILWMLWGGKRASLLPALAILLGTVVALPFLLADPGWLVDSGRRLGLVAPVLWPALIVLATVPLILRDGQERAYATVGASLSLAGLVVSRLALGGPGMEEAMLVVASFGAAMVVSAGLESLSLEPRRLLGAFAAAVIVILAIGSVGNGRLGLPEGDVNRALAFAETLADQDGPGMILVASTERGDIPGEARPASGYWYRLVDGRGMTHHQVWHPAPGDADAELEAVLDRISTGSILRPGDALGPFAVEWVVLSGPDFRLDDVLRSQLDLVPTPLNTEMRIFENPLARPLPATDAAATDLDRYLALGSVLVLVAGIGLVAASRWVR